MSFSDTNKKQRLETPQIMSNMMHKDADMSNILQCTDMDDEEKQKLYYANLERYVDPRQQKDGQIPSVCMVKDEQKQSLPDP